MIEYEIYYNDEHITSCKPHELDNTTSIIRLTLMAVLSDYSEDLLTAEKAIITKIF